MTLPGHSWKIIDPSVCCETEGHDHIPATWKVQGETDSMGCEYLYFCNECMDAFRRVPPRIGYCDWCKAADVEVFPRRDIDEGMNGPVYHVCRPCIDNDNGRMETEFEDNIRWGHGELMEQEEENVGTEPWGKDDGPEWTRQQEEEFEEALLTPPQLTP